MDLLKAISGVRAVWEEVSDPARTEAVRRVTSPAVVFGRSDVNACLRVRIFTKDAGAQGAEAGAQWASGMVEALLRLAEGKSGARPLRIEIDEESDPWLGESPGDFVRRGEPAPVVDVRISSRKSCTVLADGIVADMLCAQLESGRGAGGDRVELHTGARWVRVWGRGEDGVREIGAALLAVMHWWAHATPAEVIALLQGADELLAWRVERNAASGPPWLSEVGRLTNAIELALAGLWQLRRLLGEGSEGLDELEGWQREIELALRMHFDLWACNPASSLVALPSGSKLISSGAVDWGGVYTLPDGEGGGGLFDGERTLAEVTLKIARETPLDWEDARRLAASWASGGRVQRAPVPDHGWFDVSGLSPGLGSLPEAGKSSRIPGSFLYFSYGSCMSRYSFRKTVPRFEMIGPARLDGFRLGFTLASARRKGGTADIVPDEGKCVWGILYRVPVEYLERLDEREGVFLGRYQRRWVQVQALGVPLGPVLTYEVVSKANSDIAPSDEYAGLIWDGALGMVEEGYLRELEELIVGLGAEPIPPIPGE